MGRWADGPRIRITDDSDINRMFYEVVDIHINWDKNRREMHFSYRQMHPLVAPTTNAHAELLGCSYTCFPPNATSNCLRHRWWWWAVGCVAFIYRRFKSCNCWFDCVIDLHENMVMSMPHKNIIFRFRHQIGSWRIRNPSRTEESFTHSGSHTRPTFKFEFDTVGA